MMFNEAANMNKYSIRMALCVCSLWLLTTLGFAAQNSLGVKGIYLTQYTLENTAMLRYLIKNAKAAGIDTFVVDYEYPSKKYQRNIALLKENNINYVARITMFPHGGTPEIINDPARWQKKYALVQQAVALGATQIQMDYIRFNTKQKPSPENARKIFGIISWYKSKLAEQKIPLQVDVFGIASFGESKYIGQNIKMFSQSVDAVCPMVYPSHYVPFADHFKRPYETVFESLKHIKKQFGDPMPIKVYAYIELSNYHYPMSHAKTLDYITAQLKAVHEAGADGWYAWSPHNRYDNLFRVLGSQQVAADDEVTKTKKSDTKTIEKVATDKGTEKTVMKDTKTTTDKKTS